MKNLPINLASSKKASIFLRNCWILRESLFAYFHSLGVVQVILFLLLSCSFIVFLIDFLDADIPVESDTDDDGAPRISLAEMLEDLHISEDATGGEGANMMTE